MVLKNVEMSLTAVQNICIFPTKPQWTRNIPIVFFYSCLLLITHHDINTRKRPPQKTHNDCQEFNLRKNKLEIKFANVVAQNIVATIPINKQQSTAHTQGPQP